MTIWMMKRIRSDELMKVMLLAERRELLESKREQAAQSAREKKTTMSKSTRGFMTRRANYLGHPARVNKVMAARVYVFTALAHGRAKLCDEALRSFDEHRAERTKRKTLCAGEAERSRSRTTTNASRLQQALTDLREGIPYPVDAASRRARSADRGVEPAGWREAGC